MLSRCVWFMTVSTLAMDFLTTLILLSLLAAPPVTLATLSTESSCRKAQINNVCMTETLFSTINIWHIHHSQSYIWRVHHQSQLCIKCLTYSSEEITLMNDACCWYLSSWLFKLKAELDISTNSHYQLKNFSWANFSFKIFSMLGQWSPVCVWPTQWAVFQINISKKWNPGPQITKPPLKVIILLVGLTVLTSTQARPMKYYTKTII